MRARALLPLAVLAACQPGPVEGPGDPSSPAGYRHLDHVPPPAVLEALRFTGDDIPASALRVRDGCYAAFVDGAVLPVARANRQICL